ncbi:MAG: hypothetical protein WD604_03985 [Balneolaceae bacterium]
MKIISTRIGRLSIMSLILFSALISVIILFIEGSGGAISQHNKILALQNLVKFYLPLFAIMGAFYFAEKNHHLQKIERETSFEVFLFSFLAVLIWVIVPPSSIAFSESIQSSFVYIDSFRGYGDAIGLAAITFYFSKSTSQ